MTQRRTVGTPIIDPSPAPGTPATTTVSPPPSTGSDNTRAGRRRARPVSAIIGGTLIAVIVGASLAAPWLAPQGYDQQDLTAILRPPSWVGEYPLGTDQLGRSVLVRLLYGGRVALFVTTLAVLLSTVVGVGFALASAAGGRWADSVLGRLADIQLAVPSILLAMVVLAFSGGGTWQLVLVLALGGWVLTFRVVRSAATSIVSRPYIEAARVSGAGTWQLLRRHVLPASTPLILVTVALNFAAILLLESSLGFLGLGVQPPTPDWGQMVASGQAQLAGAWWISIFPGVVLVVLLVGVQLTGDWLAERLSTSGLVQR